MLLTRHNNSFYFVMMRCEYIRLPRLAEIYCFRPVRRSAHPSVTSFVHAIVTFEMGILQNFTFLPIPYEDSHITTAI